MPRPPRSTIIALRLPPRADLPFPYRHKHHRVGDRDRPASGLCVAGRRQRSFRHAVQPPPAGHVHPGPDRRRHRSLLHGACSVVVIHRHRLTVFLLDVGRHSTGAIQRLPREDHPAHDAEECR